MLWRLHQTIRGKKRGKMDAHPRLRKKLRHNTRRIYFYHIAGYAKFRTFQVYNKLWNIIIKTTWNKGTEVW